MDFKIKTIDFNGTIVKLQIWDTTGQERFRSITSSYYRGAHGILLLYDTTKSSSFDRIKSWLTEVDRYANQNVCKVLVGTKNDLVDEKEVDTGRVEQFCGGLGIPFFETSSKTTENVTETFLQITKNIAGRFVTIFPF